MNSSHMTTQPDRRMLRSFGLVGAFLLALCATGTALGWSPFVAPGASAVATAMVFVGAALGCAALALVLPLALQIPYTLLMLLGRPIGGAVSCVALALVYFGVVLPIGLALRALGRNPLAPRAQRQLESRWQQRTQAKSAASYHRQY